MNQLNKPHFEVHPSVVYQLGESLITDAIQALTELVKNSYDADATYAKVVIDTEGVVEVQEAFYPPSGGRVLVEDDGFGMTAEDVEGGWLMISSRKKREFKLQKKKTPRGRIPLGDKGLGRLGVQRLGENLEIFTKPEGGPGLHVGFSWLDFATAPSLQDVEILTESIEYPHSSGTKVVISDLREVEFWRGQGAIKRLEQELSRMISPFKKIRDFFVTVEVDGKALELIEITDRVREIAPIRYSVEFDGNLLKARGKARLDFFRPQHRKEAEEFALIAESDNGKSFYEFLAKQNLADTFKISRSRSKSWFVEFEWERALDSIDKVACESSGNGRIANPGPFYGEVDSFDLGYSGFDQQSVFDRLSEYRRHIKKLSGIRVYRDGFAIRVDQDWLRLGAQWTSARSYYGLKPDNTLGYVALTAGANADLEETTDREGFKDTPYYRNFYALLLEFVDFTTRAHNFFRRSWTAFKKKRNEELAEVDSRRTIEDLFLELKKRLGEAEKYQQVLISIRAKLQTSISATSALLSRIGKDEEITPQLGNSLKSALVELELQIDDAHKAILETSVFLEEINNLKGIEQVLEDRVDGLRRQTDDMYETVALGLTAEALSHEVFNVADVLAKRAKSARARLQKLGIEDRSLLAFIEYVHSAVIALRKQMSYLSPALRYVRDQKHDIEVASFLEETVEFYRERLLRNDITAEIQVAGDKKFQIKMNKGKFTQIMDNMIQNSEYWLREEIAQGRQEKGVIVFEVHRPFVRIYDNGRGIDPSVEHALFEPFISTKAKGEGRGLGLFIVKQLLDSEGSSIGLVPERNSHRRLYKFQLDFRGAIDG